MYTQIHCHLDNKWINYRTHLLVRLITTRFSIGRRRQQHTIDRQSLSYNRQNSSFFRLCFIVLCSCCWFCHSLNEVKMLLSLTSFFSLTVCVCLRSFFAATDVLYSCCCCHCYCCCFWWASCEYMNMTIYECMYVNECRQICQTTQHIA